MYRVVRVLSPNERELPLAALGHLRYAALQRILVLENRPNLRTGKLAAFPRSYGIKKILRSDLPALEHQFQSVRAPIRHVRTAQWRARGHRRKHSQCISSQLAAGMARRIPAGDDCAFHP